MAASWRLTACDVRKNPRSNTDPRMQRNYLGLTITFQRTVTTPLALCLSARVHSSYRPLRHTGRDKIRGRERSIDEHSTFQPQTARETGVFCEILVASSVMRN